FLAGGTAPAGTHPTNCCSSASLDPSKLATRIRRGLVLPDTGSVPHRAAILHGRSRGHGGPRVFARAD
ncbi:MAG TPA: hypothetical protein VGG00_04245, partial [Rhodanobacter sp.]